MPSNGKLVKWDGDGTLAVGAFTLTRTGLTVNGAPSFEEWEGMHHLLQQMEGAVHWWLGDSLNYGERTYGEMYSQAMDATGFDYQTLRDDKWVSGKIEKSRRRDSVPFSHHKEVAALPPAEQDDILDAADKNNWTLQEVRGQVRERNRLADLHEREKKAKPFTDHWRIDTTDVTAGLKALQSGTVRLAFADPPYNIGIDYGSGEGADLLSRDEFLAWCALWMAEVPRVLAPDGSFWVLINDENAAEFKVALATSGLHVRQWLLWYESFGVNNPNGFNRTHRHLFWCVNDPEQFVFHTEAVTRASDRQAKYKDKRADASPAGKTWDSVWGINPPIPRVTGTCAERMPGFPTQLPQALLAPIVGCATDPGDVVCDLFAGSGSLGEASLRQGRRFIGLELNGDYADKARLRLRAVEGDINGRR